VGICKAGQQSCASDGSAWGACQGEVLPRVELCATPEDEDCDGSPTPCQSDVAWCHAYPVVPGNYLFGVGTDAARNVVAGVTHGDFGSGTAYGPTLVKYDAAGAMLWKRTFDALSPASPFAVASDGSIVLASSFQATVDVGTGLLACPSGGRCPILVKLAPDGTTVFAKALFGANATAGDPSAVAVSASGEIGILGTLSLGGAFDCGLGPVQPAGANGIFLAKFTPSGTCTKSLAGSGSGLPSSLDYDLAGNLVVSGYFIGAMSFLGATLGGSGTFLAKIDPSGAPVYVKGFANQNAVTYLASTVTPGGDAILAAVFTGPTDLGGGLITPTASGDLVVARFDPAGNHLWSNDYGIGSSEAVFSVRADAAGDAWVSGSFQNLTDLGSGSLKSAGGNDVFLAKYGPDGKGIASHRYGDAQEQWGLYVAVNALGTPILTGSFTGTIDLGTGPMTTAGTSVFVCQLPP
jgi:hypothetical protein